VTVTELSFLGNYWAKAQYDWILEQQRLVPQDEDRLVGMTMLMRLRGQSIWLDTEIPKQNQTEVQVLVWPKGHCEKSKMGSSYKDINHTIDNAVIVYVFSHELKYQH